MKFFVHKLTWIFLEAAAKCCPRRRAASELPSGVARRLGVLKLLRPKYVCHLHLFCYHKLRWESMKRKKLEDKATVKTNQKQTREIMTEKDNQERRLLSLGDKAAIDSQEQPEKSWETAATSKSKIMRGDKLGRQPGTQLLRSKNLDSFQLSGGSRRETSWKTRPAAARNEIMQEDKLGDKAAAAKSEIMKETSLGDKAAAAAKSEIMKEISLGEGGSGSLDRNHAGRTSLGDNSNQKRNHGGRQAGRQGGSGSKERKSLRDKAAAAAESKS